MEKSTGKRARLEHNSCQTAEEIIQEQNQVIKNLKARNQKLEEVLEEVLKNSESSTASTTTGNSGNQNIIMMVPSATGGSPAIQTILPEMLEEEPLYVNPKQYHRILKRRQARAKLEAEGRIPKEGKKLRLLLPRAL